LFVVVKQLAAKQLYENN